MIVEDNITLLENIAFELEMHDYEVIQASNGESALNLLYVMDSPPDIIVSDIAMPKMDGYKFLESVRQYDKWNDIPFLFLTAFDSKNAVRIGKELGADDYLTKPFQPDELIVAVENKLQRVAQLRQAAMRHLDNARDDLIHMLTHELRTPLTLVFSGAEALRLGLADVPDESAHVMLDVVQNGAKRMNRLVNNILYLIAIDSGQLDSRLEKYRDRHDIQEIVMAACNAIWAESAFAKSGVETVIDMADESLYVYGISEYLVMMVAEILRNALTFSPKDGQVHINVQRMDNDVLITITDEGRGIPEEKLDVVWERFAQVEREQFEQQGTGLGLALVRESARRHGGDCTIQSQDRQGTQVTLRLPLAFEGDVMGIPDATGFGDPSSLKR
jgi:signal transduction histidine kinase